MFVSIFLPHTLFPSCHWGADEGKGRIDLMEAPGAWGEPAGGYSGKRGRGGAAGRGGAGQAAAPAAPAVAPCLRVCSQALGWPPGVRPGVVLPGRGGKELEPEPAGPRKPALRGPGLAQSRILGAKTNLPP